MNELAKMRDLEKMKTIKIILILLLIVSLGGCKPTYNYYLIVPKPKETKSMKAKYYFPTFDRWNHTQINEELSKIKINQ